MLGVCVIGGIWVHRMAEVYAPKILTDLVVSHTISYVGSHYAGIALGTLVVAPGVVPTLLLVVAYLPSLFKKSFTVRCEDGKKGVNQVYFPPKVIYRQGN